MRQVGFSKYERVAGLFILVAIGGAILSAFSVAVKQGWFETKSHYATTFANADGVHAGAAVKMAGLTVGAVDEVDLLSDNRVRVSFYVLGRFKARIRQDSKATLIRPFIIGDRVVEVSVGSESLPALAEHDELKSEESLDIMTIMGGKRMGQVFDRVGGLMGSLETVAEAFSDQRRMESVIRIFDRLDPMIANLDTMSREVIKLSRQATRDDNLQRTLSNTASLTSELNDILPELNKANPEMGRDIAVLTRSLGKMTMEMEKAMAELGPDGKNSARRAVEALNEATILVKALQKSFFLRSSVKEVRQEEEQEQDRQPASEERSAP